MSDSEISFSSVEDFLTEERKKLDEDRRAVDLILTLLKNDQQIFSDYLNDETTQVELLHNEEAVTTLDSENDDNREKLIRVNSPKKLKIYNSQVEKERLAYLFENSPSFFSYYPPSRKYRFNERCKSGFENKENQNPLCCCRSRSKILASPRKHRSDPPIEKNDNVENMVRAGEFSPLKVVSNSADRSLLGIGEYEGRRRTFLEKKKQEYIEYLSNMRRTRRSQPSRSEEKTSEDHEDDGYVSHSSDNSPYRKESRTYRKIFTPDRGLIEDAELDHHFTKIQQENYRRELDNQIKEREKSNEKRRNGERLECQKSQCEDIKHRRDVMKRIEDDFNRRLKVLNDCKSENEAKNKKPADQKNQTENPPPNRNEKPSRTHQWNDPFADQHIETCSIENVPAYEKMKKELYRRELSKQIEEKRQLEEQRKNEESKKQHQTDANARSQIPHYLGNPFMKQSAESCAIDDLEEYRRMKDELYKKELDQQIEEKRKLEKERKAKAEEADKKFEEKLKNDEERRLIEEYERDEALRNYQASQKVQEDKCHTHEIRKSKDSTKPLLKTKILSSTNSKLNDKSTTKSVSFAPQTHVIYNIDAVENSRRTLAATRTTKCNDDSIIIEAPYILAVKNVSNVINIDNDGSRKKPISPNISSECIPIPPNVSQPLPEIGNLPIPSAVSMSEHAVREYFKSNAFSDLSQIRRMLRERQANSH